MKNTIRLTVFATLIVTFAWGRLALASPLTPDDQSPPAFKVLVFSKTAGFRHASIPVGIKAIIKLGTEQDFTVEATEDATFFDDENLHRFSCVIFLSTTGDILDDRQEEAFTRYIRDGGGFVGIHAASDTEYEWEWYGELVGAYFKSHPRIQEATVHISDDEHPSTRHLSSRWTRTDEWYDYRDNPREKVHVLATVDESSYEGGTMGADHPIAWCHEYEGGRSWYTGGGHTEESFTEPEFLQHLLGGIYWASNRLEGQDADASNRTIDETVQDDQSPNS